MITILVTDLATWPDSTDQVTWINAEGGCQLAQHRDAGRPVGGFEFSDVASTKAGSMRQLFLRQLLVMTHPTQLYGHDLLEVHGSDGAYSGFIVPGTIVPSR